jgi:putative transposase
MPYWRLFYHIVWVTQDRAPLISAEIETSLFHIVIAKGEQLGAYIFAVNGMPDHVHMVAAVPPSIALSEYIRQLKGASSHFMRIEFNEQFTWQKGYGVISVSERNLPQAIAYVERQKERHRDGTTLASLERIDEANHGPRVVLPRSDSPDPTAFEN